MRIAHMFAEKKIVDRPSQRFFLSSWFLPDLSWKQANADEMYKC